MGYLLKLYISWRSMFEPDDPRRGEAAVTVEPDKLRRRDQAHKTAARLWESWVWSHGGSIVNNDGDNGRAELPAGELDELDKLRRQVGGCLEAEVAIGVGLRVDEADMALKSARKRGGDCIVLYTLECLKEQSPEDKLAKAGPAANQGAGAGFGGVTEPAKPSVAKPHGEASEHTQGEVGRQQLEDMPSPETTHAAADFEEQFHDQADAYDDRQAEADTKSQRGRDLDEVKAQIIKILQNVKAQAPNLELIRQTEPDLFAAVQGMVRALLMMAHQLVDGQSIQKSEPDFAMVEMQELHPMIKAQAFFREAGFLGKDGKIVGTGPFHDVEGLPPGFEIQDEGFIGHDDKFYNREEAARMAGAAKPLHSEDIGMSIGAARQIMKDEGDLNKGDVIPLNPKQGPNKRKRANAEVVAIPTDANTQWDAPGNPEHGKIVDPNARKRAIHGELPPFEAPQQVARGLGSSGSHNIYDYSHMLSPELQQQGFGLYVNHTPGQYDDYMHANVKYDGKNVAKMWTYPHSNLQHRGMDIEDPMGILTDYGHITWDQLPRQEFELGLRRALLNHQNWIKSGTLVKGKDIPAKEHQGVGEGAAAQPSGFLSAAEKLPMPGEGPKHKLQRPPGAVKDAGPTGSRDVGKVKVTSSDGHAKWRQVRAGQVASPDGSPTSSRNPSPK